MMASNPSRQGFEAYALRSPSGWPSCAAPLARGRDTHTLTRACFVLALRMTGSPVDGAITAAHGLADAAEATRNPQALSFALLAYGFAFIDADPAGRWRHFAAAF